MNTIFMDNFDKEKRTCLNKLYKPDKSRKGTVDEPIIPLIEYINSLDNYYTTSSCSGRIYLLTEANKKPDVKWIYVSHDVVDEETLIKSLYDSLNKLKEIKDRIWFRQENMILHVACRTIDHANILLNIARNAGFRRSGIIANSKIIIVEICSTEKIDVPLTDNGKILVNEDYIRVLVKIANEKFIRGKKKLENFEKEVREKLV
ncbi:MAG: hypothetical protein KatS3mg002_0783 [Candidatus Woesearchaeota archaeon]|nr:MAG: hypothetical protein KatS3mg002_0783 [Candidatus Woesearchaeota archaeon]